MLFILSIDRWLFFFINHAPHAPLFDALAMTLSGVYGSTVAVWILLSIVLFIREEERDHWFFLPVILASAASAFITNVWLKNAIARFRPQVLPEAISVGAPLSDFSFPSGHATFAWALAVVLTGKEPRAKWLFYLLAFAISLSRIYLGKHYPSDVVVGGILGWVIGKSALMIERIILVRKRKR